MTVDGTKFIYLFIHSFLFWIASILEEIKKKKSKNCHSLFFIHEEILS